jgi:WD40 repeat protein
MLLGVALLLHFPAPAGQPSPSTAIRAAKAPLPRIDLYGDPLPPDASVRLGTVRWRHRSVAGLAYVGNGKRLLSWSDHGLRLWDAATGQVLRQTGDTVPGPIHCSASTADGKFVAFSDHHNAIRVWDVEAW